MPTWACAYLWQVNGFTCQCVDGWEGDDCGDNIDDCLGSPCENNATCNDFVANYTCTCLTGFTGRSQLLPLAVADSCVLAVAVYCLVVSVSSWWDFCVSEGFSVSPKSYHGQPGEMFRHGNWPRIGGFPLEKKMSTPQNKTFRSH